MFNIERPAIFADLFFNWSLTGTEWRGVLAPPPPSVTEDQAGSQQWEAFVALRPEDGAPVFPHSHSPATRNLAQSGRVALTDCCKQRGGGGLSPDCHTWTLITVLTLLYSQVSDRFSNLISKYVPLMIGRSTSISTCWIKIVIFSHISYFYMFLTFF